MGRSARRSLRLLPRKFRSEVYGFPMGLFSLYLQGLTGFVLLGQYSYPPFWGFCFTIEAFIVNRRTHTSPHSSFLGSGVKGVYR